MPVKTVSSLAIKTSIFQDLTVQLAQADQPFFGALRAILSTSLLLFSSFAVALAG